MAYLNQRVSAFFLQTTETFSIWTELDADSTPDDDRSKLQVIDTLLDDYSVLCTDVLLQDATECIYPLNYIFHKLGGWRRRFQTRLDVPFQPRNRHERDKLKADHDTALI